MNKEFKEAIAKIVKQEEDAKKPIVAQGTKIAVTTRQIPIVKVDPFSI